MKPIFKYIVIIVGALCLSCSASKEISKKENLQFGNNKYEILLPKKAYKKEVIDNGGESSEIRFVFPDSTIIFFTDNKSATPLVSKFLTPNDYLKFIDEENLKYEFAENESLFFLEKRGSLFMGFANMPKMSKSKYYKILLSVKKK